MHVGVVFQEELDDLEVASEAGHVQSGELLVSGWDVDPFFDQSVFLLFALTRERDISCAGDKAFDCGIAGLEVG